MGIRLSSTRQEREACSKCLRHGTFFQPVSQCVGCKLYLCADCSKPLASDQIDRQRSFRLVALPGRCTPRCCFSCRSSLLSLNDEILRYITLFLTYKNQDRLLRVCTRFQSVLFLPYEYAKSIEERYRWRDPYDILYASRRSAVLRGVDRTTGVTYALKLIPKSQMLSRRMWQRLQQYIDIRMATSSLPPYFAVFHNVFQTRDFIVLVMELLPPERYQPLSTIMHERTLTETECQRIVGRLLEAVRCLHEELRVVHRELSPDAVFVACDDLGDIRLLRLRNARFLHPSPSSFYLQEMRRKQQQQQQREQEKDQRPDEEKASFDACSSGPTETLPPLVVESSGAAAAGQSPAVPVSSVAVETSATMLGGGAALNPATRSTLRPPRLHIPVDFALLRRAEMYARVARDREAQLQAAETRSKGFSHGAAPSLASAAQPVPAAATSTAADPPACAADGSGNGDEVVILATPRAAPGYAAPELSALLCAQSVVPSLTRRAGDVTRWDVFALGGIFYQLLASARNRGGSARCVGWGELSSGVSGQSLALMLRLMHVDPSRRASCREALNLLLGTAQLPNCASPPVQHTRHVVVDENSSDTTSSEINNNSHHNSPSASIFVA